MTKWPASIWMASAFSVALMLAAATLATFGAGEDGTRVALQLTARFSYGFFWLAYTGAALATLFGPFFQPLAKRGREMGLAFASAHLPHVALVIWLYHISLRPPVRTATLVFFAIAVIFTYLLALLSSRRVAALLPAAGWRWVRLIGVEYIALAFLRDFFDNPFHNGLLHLIAYLPFIVLAGAAVLLRLAALGKRRRDGLDARDGVALASPRPAKVAR